MGTWALPYERYYLHLFTKRSGLAPTGTTSQRADFRAPLRPLKLKRWTLFSSRDSVLISAESSRRRALETPFCFLAHNQEVQRAVARPPCELATIKQKWCSNARRRLDSAEISTESRELKMSSASISGGARGARKSARCDVVPVGARPERLVKSADNIVRRASAHVPIARG